MKWSWKCEPCDVGGTANSREEAVEMGFAHGDFVDTPECVIDIIAPKVEDK